jgi:hypothetical protein
MTRYLAGIVDLPYVTPAGRFVTRVGYDAETSLYLNVPMDWQTSVPDRIDEVSVRAALKLLAEPFSAYRFATPDDAAGMVSAIFSAVSRPVLDLCPATMVGAAVQGSGKTKAATALGAIVEGQRVGVTPFSGASTDDELRKRLVAGAIGGVRFHCLDNIVGHFKSSVLAAVLTSGKLSDRVLGQSRMVEAEVRSLITLTGNNSSMDADLLRRTVQVRIDSGSAPTHRAFGFDPISVALAQRRRIADAVCTVQLAYFAAGSPDIVAGDAGGFADWNRLCRQVILWLAREGYADALPWPLLGDPAASMLADPANSDPEIEATGDLLTALWALSEGRDFASAEVLAWHNEGRDTGGVPGDLRSAIVECVGKQDINVRGIGRVLLYRRDRVVGGLKLLARGGGRLKSWRVVLVE